MLKAKDGDFFITDWLRNRNTLEYIGIWEKVYNPNFNYGEFATIRNQSGLNSFKISVKEFVAKTNAICIQAKAGRSVLRCTSDAPEIDYDSGQYLEDIVRSMIEEETKNIINGLSDYLKFVFKAWDDEHEEEPDLLSYNMVYSEVCRRADEECFPSDEWAEDKYWWSFRHPLDNEVKRLREKVDYDDARNKKWNKKSGPHNSEGPILLVTK
ncbi:KilA-N domain-containing protein [Anaerovibrio lipolyticus DSM 3074]|uniref:KilA-N domain-containing protein n=1 Tax=Anaerovibrio lipolyticus DSM 3074 TaxID=1120997 RepID=A0A1M6EQM1_9FIRM|nr:KilA-N domain-containing protein [Anaerovibrio lipolyticus]SHI87782.1 KilA-N domain-containing protein [Anaerovibrio lipolyticus DSM 3074]